MDRSDVKSQVDALPEIFDQAFSQWCEYFEVDESSHVNWRARAYLMKSAPELPGRRVGPADLPEFGAGFSRGDQIWILEQASDYYQRHLLLHEGTHVFMDRVVGGKGPPWFSEGMAELLATHRFENGRLALNMFPASRSDVPKWGRIEMVQSAFENRRAMNLDRIFAYDSHASLENQSYAWCWAAAVFFDHQMRYQSRFRRFARSAGAPDFAAEFSQAFATDRPRINEAWRLYVANLDYAYDFQRNEVEFDARRSTR